jgi:hypothetical protein
MTIADALRLPFAGRIERNFADMQADPVPAIPKASPGGWIMSRIALLVCLILLGGCASKGLGIGNCSRDMPLNEKLMVYVDTADAGEELGDAAKKAAAQCPVFRPST